VYLAVHFCTLTLIIRDLTWEKIGKDSARWNRETGVVVVHVMDITFAFANYTICFDLVNPPAGEGGREGVSEKQT